MKVQVKFMGRKTGSIGIDYEIKLQLDIPENSTYDDIKNMLYVDYEHIKLDKRDIFLVESNDRFLMDLIKG